MLIYIYTVYIYTYTLLYIYVTVINLMPPSPVVARRTLTGAKEIFYKYASCRHVFWIQ